MRIIFISFLLVINIVHAQNNTGVWAGYFGNFNLSKKFNIHNELQYRNNTFESFFDQFILRNGIGYNISPDNNNLLLGYAYILSSNHKFSNGKPNDLRIKEHRVFQQFITKNAFKRVFLLHRYRIEQRIFNNHLKLRFRYFMALYIPLNHNEITKNTWYLATSNEIFINQKHNIFDQNRLYGALGYALSKNIKVEFGVLTQFFENNRNTQFQVSFFNNLAFKHHYTKIQD